MSTNVQITVRSIPDSPTIAFHVNKHLARINRMYNKIGNCRVVVDLAQKNSHKGRVFSVSLDLTTPGKEFACRKHNRNLLVAIRYAFDAADRLMSKHYERKLSIISKQQHMGKAEHQNESTSAA